VSTRTLHYLREFFAFQHQDKQLEKLSNVRTNAKTADFLIVENFVFFLFSKKAS